MPGDLKILGRDAGAIFPARENLSRDANVACRFRDVKGTGFPSALTIDASVFTDQPEARSDDERRGTLKASILVEKRRGDFARESQQRVKEEWKTDESKDGKKTPDVCASETCGKKRIKEQTCTDASKTNEEDPRISPTKLSEMINKEINHSIKEINNSIKDAVQTIVKQCSMEEKKPEISPRERERRSRVCRFRVAEEHREKSSNLSSSNRRATCPTLRKCDNPIARDSSFSRAKTHNGSTMPASTGINNEKRNKKHSKPPASTGVSADNRRMTGNVNIYICSEANDGSPDKSGRRSKSQSCADGTSSDTIAEQSNSRCASSSSASSSCRLINCIQEKRRKLQAQRRLSTPPPPPSPCGQNAGREDRSSDSDEDNVVCDNSAHRVICGKVSSESNNNRGNIKLGDNKDDVECGDAISPTGDCCRKDANSTTDPPAAVTRCEDSSESAVIAPCASFSMFDNSVGPRRSWTEDVVIYPTKAETEVSRLNSSDTSLNYHTGNEHAPRSHVCGNVCDGEYSGARDGRQRKSIRTDRGYQNKKRLQNSSTNGGIRRRRVGCKPWQSAEGCRREYATSLQRSACSCIAEEEEDRCASADDKVGENELPEGVCERATCPEKLSVRRFSAAVEARTCESAWRDLAECPNGYYAAVRVTTFGNSEESKSEVTRVRKELLAAESSADIAVRATTMVFGEPKGTPEEATVSFEAARPEERAPKETICTEKISDSDFADVEKVSASGAEDKLAGGNTNNSSNLNNQKGNVGSIVGAMRSNNKYGDNFAGRNKSAGNTKRDEQVKKLASNDDELNTRDAPVGSIGDSGTALPKSARYSVIPRDSANLASNPGANEISNARPDQQGSLKFQRPNRPLRNYSRQSGGIAKKSAMRDRTSRENNNRAKEKARSEARDEKHNIPKEAGTKKQPREPLLYRSIKKLADILRHTREQLRTKKETEEIESKEKIVGKRDAAELKAISETEDEIIDEKGRELVEIEAPRSPLADGEISKEAAKPESIAADFGVSERDEKTDETPPSKPKLFRVIAAKKLRRVPTTTAADSEEPEAESVRVVTEPREPELESPAVETITSDRVDQEKTFQEETIAQEPILETIREDTKVEEPIVPKISIAEIRKVPTEDIADIPKGVPDEGEVSKDAADERTRVYAPFPDEKQREDLRKFTRCKCGAFPEPNDSYLTVKRAKLYVPCPQKKTEEESKKIIPCTPFSFHPKGCICLSYRSTQCGPQCSLRVKECFCKNNERIDYCAPPRYPKSCPKTSRKFDKPKFRDVSPSKIRSHICLNCCKMKEECVCGKTAFSYQPRQECKCRSCATRADCLKMADEHRPRDQCSCVFLECNGITKVCNCRKAMICLYCDNPRDKCACRAPIGKCPSCGMPSDVCNCQVVNEMVDIDRKWINEKTDENRTIRVTSWKPRREIRRYFTRNLEDQSNFTKGCRCHEIPYRQHVPEEQLPYQRLNIFSDVMNELQQKISESICCPRCWKNPCCCELPASQNKESEDKKPKGHVRCPEIEKSPTRLRNKSPHNCRCNSSPKTERKNIAEKSIPTRRTCCCELSPCGCRRNRTNNKKPLAKCYYCKSLPCVCVTAR